jgi:hypothetical protein
MAKVGEYQVVVDRILGLQASSINPFDARTVTGQLYRGGMLASYVVNDVAALQWLTGGQIDLSTPQGKAEAAFKVLFALGNAGKTAESIAGLSGGISGRLNETNPIFKSVFQKYSNWALTIGGGVWTAGDFSKVLTDLSSQGLGVVGLDGVKGFLDLAFTYGMYRITDFEAKKAGGQPVPHGRNLAWASIVVGGALVLRELIRELEPDRKKEANIGKGTSPRKANDTQTVAPTSSTTPTVH